MNNTYVKITSFIFFIFVLFLNYLKTPYIFQSGRFIENDAVHYANALNSNWIEVMFLIYWPAGYLNLFANTASFLNSRFISIEFAALFNVYFSFLVILLIHIYVLFIKSDFLKSNKEKFITSLILTVSPIFVFEIWLDSMNAQIYLCILSFFILFAHNNILTKFLSPFILFFSGLSGVYSCLLTPLFFYKFFKFRTGLNKLNFLILLSSSFIQLMIIFYAKFTNSLVQGKLNLNFFLNYNELESYTYNIIIRPFLSSTLSNHLIQVLKIENNIFLKSTIILLTFLLILLFLFFFLKTILKKREILNFQIVSLIYLFLSCSFLVTIGGVNDSVGGRYSVIPAFCISFLIFKFAFTKELNSFFKRIFFILIFISLTTGIYDYRIKKWIIFYECIECPNWKEEVAKFKINKNYKIKVWPYDVEKKIDLNVKYY